MDAVTIVQQNIDVERILRYYDFEHIKCEGNLIRACCKLHNGDNPSAFVINTDNGLWYCHTGGCGGGDIFTLVQRLEGFNSFSKTVRWLSDFLGIDISTMQIVERKVDYIKDLQKFIATIRQKRKTELKPYYLDVPVKEVVKFRDFQESTLQHFKLGHIDAITLLNNAGESYTLYNRLVFPIIVNDMQVGVSLRRVNNNDQPKWSHQPLNIATNKLLYNCDVLNSCAEIVICEGITDVWAFHEIGVPAVAVFGSHISKEQYKRLMYSGANIIFAFDGDEAGQAATNKAVKLFRHKANIEVISLDINTDPESITREALLQKYEQRIKLY